MPLDHGCGLDQHHHLQAARPSSVEPGPEQAVASTKPRSAGPLPMENGQLMSESKHLQFQRARRRNRKETRETIADGIASMPATIRRSAQNSNVFRAYGIMSSDNFSDYAVHPRAREAAGLDAVFGLTAVVIDNGCHLTCRGSWAGLRLSDGAGQREGHN